TGADKLRVGPAIVGERSQARSRLVHFERVIHPPIAGADVGQTETHIANLSLQGEVELVNAAVGCLEGISARILTGNVRRTSGGWERVGHLKQRHAVIDAVE